MVHKERNVEWKWLLLLLIFLLLFLFLLLLLLLFFLLLLLIWLLEIRFHYVVRLASNSCSSCLSLPSAVITRVHHHAQFPHHF
jgi:hypothetical protein